MQLLFADSFLTGSVLTIVLPLGIIIALAGWFAFSVRRVPSETPRSARLPPAEVVEAAGADIVDEVTPAAQLRTSDHDE